MKPPNEIDGACVIEWAWSGNVPFGEVTGEVPTEIFGLAVASYDNRAYYRFACDRNWETVQDAVYDSIESAKNQLPDQYRNVDARWIVW